MEEARVQVERVFGVSATLARRAERPSGTLDPRRGQHLSAGILRWLVAMRPPGATKLLGVTDVDLFIPILTFVFGEAKLDGVVAVVSTARLSGDAGGGSPRVSQARLVKECIHELGHTFGLIHCADPRCAMARSVNLAHVDAKRATLCADCRIRLSELRHGGGDAYGR
ncbi:MAG: peptidase M54 [Candidatus Rokubacteria bacterium]|nr:peptidase M54 [Candidatus Rokubacteria bacterium]